MVELTPIFKILGVGVASHFGGVALENMGHGGKVVYLKIAGYVVSAYIAFDAWWDALRHIAHLFGVIV
ncbi:hypothetical protein ABEV74_15205 [Paenibacillus cisolokensis]|uniref:hypothetical protein n=1 Tax=Paenibacillus cisolokensis TaxID=1658519 RepID=UPI003D2B8C5A